MTDEGSLDALASDYTAPFLRSIAFRVRSRVAAILERDGSEQAAIEGMGIGISYLLAKDIADALDDGITEIERLQAALATANSAADAEMERVKACEHIAAGDEGWQTVRNVCPSEAVVAALRDEFVITKATLARTAEMLDKTVRQMRWARAVGAKE